MIECLSQSAGCRIVLFLLQGEKLLGGGPTSSSRKLEKFCQTARAEHHRALPRCFLAANGVALHSPRVGGGPEQSILGILAHRG